MIRLCCFINSSKIYFTNYLYLPDRTVKTAAKALSLSPSMTLLEWKSSRHMRLKPTTSSRMYRTSDTTDSHSTPAKHSGCSHFYSFCSFFLVMVKWPSDGLSRFSPPTVCLLGFALNQPALSAWMFFSFSENIISSAEHK